MEILYLLVPLSVVLVFLIGAIFWWSVRSGQFDDMEGPGYRVLMDDDRPSVGRAVSNSAGTPTAEATPGDAGDKGMQAPRSNDRN
ncbi:MAG: cbb3-type cytochrome oxidase assembly protein CcoS [Denitratisoma sp.]|nr:cbb3-type cytochrome oxidase assembly protein CcoS [Denitratisoma sp.]